MKGFSMKDAPIQFVQYKKGDIISGTVVMISSKGVIVNIGGMKDGIIMQSINARTFKEGDTVLAIFTGEVDDSGCYILDAENVNRIISEKEQIKSIKVGSTISFAVKNVLSGGLAGNLSNYSVFLPYSQMTSSDFANKDTLFAKQISAVILEIDNIKKNIVCSSKLIEAQNNAKIIMNVGDKILGKCFKIFDKFALVNLENGLEAKILIKDISHEKIYNINEHLNTNEVYEFVVLQTDENHINNLVGLKQLKTHPDIEKMQNIKIGDAVEGVVVKLYPSGALIKLSSGLTAFAVTRENSDKANVATHHIFKLNNNVTGHINHIDPENQKINIIVDFK